MQRLITALLTTLCGACASTSSRPAAPTAGKSTEHGAGPHQHTAHEHAHAAGGAHQHAHASGGAHQHAHASGGAHQHAAHQHAHAVGGPHHAFANADALTKVFDDPSRDEWQHPDEVLRALELTPSMLVADVGAGTGYFAVRLARAVPQGEVTATDLEPDMVRFLNERAQREQLPNLRATLVTPSDSGLAAESVDRILVVHVWHHLTQRQDYARALAKALRPEGRLFIVDFNASALRGPPANMRVAAEVVVAELEGAGLSAKVSTIALPGQYIVEARRIVETRREQ